MRYILSSLIVIVALALAFNPMIAAQQQRDVPVQGANTVVDERGDGPDLGWLGLVGLIGLAGLRRRDSRDHTVVRTEPHPSPSR